LPLHSRLEQRFLECWTACLAPGPTLGALLGTYALGLAALLLLTWRRGSAALSKSWLLSLAAKPLRPPLRDAVLGDLGPSFHRGAAG
jgi:hypothetical protein